MAVVALMLAGLGRGTLALALLVHAFHLAVLALHLLATGLAIMLGVAVLAVVHVVVLGMGIGRRGGLGVGWESNRERDRADDGLHFNNLRKILRFETVNRASAQLRRRCCGLWDDPLESEGEGDRPKGGTLEQRRLGNRLPGWDCGAHGGAVHVRRRRLV